MSTAQPLVSICMPVYNAEPYIAWAIEGLLAQSYGHFELIICDNCSTDGSLAVAHSYREKDKRIRVVENRRNLGFGGNLHKVTSLARGDFMMVHCADDLSAPDALMKLSQLFSRRDLDPTNTIFIADAYVLDNDVRTCALARRPDGYDSERMPIAEYVATGRVDRFSGHTALAYALGRLSTVGFLGAILYPKRLYDAIEGVYNGLDFAPDAPYMYQLLGRNPEVVWLNEPLFTMRLHSTNHISAEKKQPLLKQTVDMYMLSYGQSSDFLRQHGLEESDLARRFVDAYCLKYALQQIKDDNPLLALRYLAFAVASYPRLAWRNPKFYLALAGLLSGPAGRALAKVGYDAGIWRRKPRAGASAQPQQS